jgi:flap endonuclease-1
LINAAILIGTDFNSGIKGIGPKTALKIVREGRIEEYYEQMPRHEEVADIFLKPISVNDYSVKIGEINEARVIDLLVNKNKFSLTRVEKNLKSLQKALKQNKQAGLSEFI